MSSMVLREFCAADAQEINRLAVTAFEEFGCNFPIGRRFAAFYGRVSDLAEIVGSLWQPRLLQTA